MMFFWYTLPLNVDGSIKAGPDGRLHRPAIENGKKMPERRTLHSGDMSEFIVDKAKRITPAEINSFAFTSQQLAVDFLSIAIKRIVVPKKKEVAAAAPAPKLRQEDAGASMLGLAPMNDDDELITANGVVANEPPPTKTWLVFKLRDGSKTKLDSTTVTELPKGVLELTEADISSAEAGTFNEKDLLKRAFTDKTQMHAFTAAYKRGIEKRKTSNA